MSAWNFAKLALYIALASSAALLPATAFAVANVLHRYTFNDGTVNDSVGTAHGTLFVPTNPLFAAKYNAGRLDLRANDANSRPAATISATNGTFVDLPGGLFSSSMSAGVAGAITLESWVIVDTNRTHTRVWSFGYSAPNGTDPYWGQFTDWVDLNSQNGTGAANGVSLTTHDSSQGNGNSFATNELVRPGSMPTGSLQHLVATLDRNDTAGGVNTNGTMRLYVNDVSAGAAAISANLNFDIFSDIDNHLGRSQWGDQLFDGQIDEFAIYDAAMTADDVHARFLAGPAPTPIPTFVINRATGQISVENHTSINFNLKSYSLSSAQSMLDPVAWQSITDTGGFGTGWSETSATSTQLAESTASAGGQLLANTGTRSLGNAWIRTPAQFQDLTATFVLGDGSTGTADITYSGAAIASGDLNGDGSINAADWTIFLTNADTSFAGQTGAQAYLKGDLNGDLANDIRDFRLFKAAFVANNGAAAFAALLGGNVPEPTALALAAMGLVGLAFGRRTRKPLLVIMCVLFIGSLCGQIATAATPITYVASGDPGPAAPDPSVPDANGGIDDVWTTTQSLDGGRGSGFFGFLPPAPATPIPRWALFSYPITAINGSIQADHTFAGGPLSVGQAVRLDFANRGVAALGSVGVSLTSNGTPVATFKYNGQDPLGVYRYDDAGGLDQATTEPFAALNYSPLEFRIDGGNKYVAAYGASSWSGTALAGPIDGIRVFNNGGGDASDLIFDNLTIGDTTLIPLSLEVNRSNNIVKIKGNPTLMASIDYYQISSAANGLNSVLWNSLDQQNLNAVDGPGDADLIAGNSPSEGWDKLPNSNSGHLKEYFVRAGGSAVPVGGELSLGQAYNQSTFGSADGDLVFQYGLINGMTLSGAVSYIGVPPGGVDGDYNEDGTVNAADYTIWRNHLGQIFNLPNRNPLNSGAISQADYTFWKTNFGNPIGSGGGSIAGAVGVPEPTSAILLLVAAAAGLRFRRR